MNKAINRTTVQVEDNKYKVYCAPLFYKDENGDYSDIDLTFEDSKSTIGDISLMNKGILSVGKRKDKNPYKITGIRPGEKLHEEMITISDSYNTIESKKFYINYPKLNKSTQVKLHS